MTSFFAGITHFDDFDRPDTAPGTISPGPQGQEYELFSTFLNDPCPYGHIENKRFVMPSPSVAGVRPCYAMNRARSKVARFGAVLEYDSIPEPGPNGYVWALILSMSRARFTDYMIHLSGSHYGWHLNVWRPDGSKLELHQADFIRSLDYGLRHVIDVKLDGSRITITSPQDQISIRHPELAAFEDARFLVIEHYLEGPAGNVNRFPAWYYQVHGEPLADAGLYVPFGHVEPY